MKQRLYEKSNTSDRRRESKSVLMLEKSKNVVMLSKRRFERNFLIYELKMEFTKTEIIVNEKNDFCSE